MDFAGQIARVLSELDLREGRVFTIRGGWGFGKSSLKNLVAEKLDADENGADWLDFNPWQWGDSDAIARALFGQIADKLGSRYSADAAASAEALRRYGTILSGAAEPLKEAGARTQFWSMVLTNASVIAIASGIGFDLPTVARVAAAFAALSAVVSIVGRVLTYLGRDRTAEPLDKVRRELEKSLRKLDRPLVIFVDDIDRLEPEQIRLLVRQVKANANLPNLVFVLLFQPSIVERALDPIADGAGRAFLEKVIQTNFDLPAVPTSVVHGIFGEELSALAGAYATEDNGFQQTRWGNVFVGCIQPRLRNMRDARRLISSIAVHLPLHAARNTFEVNVIDFLALETLRVFEPDLHERLFGERDLLLQSSHFRGDGRRDADRAAIERFLETVRDERRDWTKDMLKELFPTLEWAFGGTNYGEDWYLKWLAAKRVCSSRYFPRYFELQTALGELSESGFVDFLAATVDEHKLSVAIADIEANGLLASLVARLDESVERLPVENASLLLPAMYGMGEKLVDTREAGPFSSPWLSAWRATSWFLKRIPSEIRGKLAIEALARSEALSVGAVLIHLSDPADREEGKEDRSEPTLDIQTVEAMKVEWLRQVRIRAGEPGRLIADSDLVSLLYRWRDYAGSMNEPQAWVEDAIRTDEAFVKVMTRLMSRGASQSLGDRVATPHYTFDRKIIEDFIGIDRAKTRCAEIDPAAFSQDKITLQTLQRQLGKWLEPAET
ncbi:hypothetical protein GCM10007874_37200 [Labrys miyagiensis]|uniref:KAP NTPase domain-containing protein n=1 Tax=Labrys miyagiensis TaxID=346912 RepID=A0ABQ6CK41_9HYPH|nr:hypothetical protein GCM10007874_37200 [Labrys miyagiensis]